MLDRFGFLLWLIACATTCLAVTSPAQADPIAVGSGNDHVACLVQFSDEALYDFDVAFTDDNLFTGMNVLDVLESAGIGFTTVRVFGGAYIDGIAYDGHDDSGFGGGENWWHYWYMEPGDANWTAALVGAGDRIMHDGFTEGWVYGFATAPGEPTPEPAAISVLLVSTLALLRRRHHPCV